MTWFDFGVMVVLIGGVLAGLAWLADRRLDAPVEEQPRPDRRIPKDELALTGEDYREPVADFLAESFIRRTRNRFAIYLATGADPEKNEAASLPRPASRTKELSSYATFK